MRRDPRQHSDLCNEIQPALSGTDASGCHRDCPALLAPVARTPQIDADVVHNWGARYILNTWAPLLTPAQADDIKAACYRHHQMGTDAKAEAAALNAKWAVRQES